MIAPVVITIVPLYAALLGLLFVPMTLRAGLYRVKHKINIGDGGDPELLRRIRGQANFIESVPLALLLLLLMELTGAATLWLHTLGLLLLAGRIAHYLGLTGLGPFMLRPIGMVATFCCYLGASGWLLYHALQ